MVRVFSLNILFFISLSLYPGNPHRDSTGSSPLIVTAHYLWTAFKHPKEVTYFVTN